MSNERLGESYVHDCMYYGRILLNAVLLRCDLCNVDSDNLIPVIHCDASALLCQSQACVSHLNVFFCG